MNQARKIARIIGDAIQTRFEQPDVLEHYGTPRHSGRYPWGSGKNPQRSKNFHRRVLELRAKGLTDTEIAKGMGMSTTDFRARMSNAKAEKRAEDRNRALELKDKGYSNVKIGEMMGINESSVRSLLNEKIAERNDLNKQTADSLKKFVDEYKYIDIGPGTEIDLGVTDNRLKNAINYLEEHGYKKQYVKIDQMGTDHQTTIKVLTAEDVPYSELRDHKYDIKTIGNCDRVIDIDGTRLPAGQMNTEGISSDRIFVRYLEDGGADKDGTIELRRGVADISLGNARYAQVRVGVDGKYYMKGMALYSDDIPDGYDVVYNSKKPAGSPMDKVFKKMKDDGDNPYGASIRDEDSLARVSRYYIDPKTGEKKLSAINVVNEEGDWDRWNKTLASQFLSKQSVPLAKRQLDLAYAEKKAQFDEIMSLTNPTVKKAMLESFSDDCDASAVHLKAAALPRQKAHVILPFNDIKDTEIYAPNYKNGEHVVLIRFPHGGKFEIPELVVNNKKGKAKDILGNAIDAVGINIHVAERLSGADFDGDTVLVIPVGNKVKVSTSPALEGLKNFNHLEKYALPDDAPKMKAQTKQVEMGKVTNLITDMTLKGATDEELARAVRHSMVIIDAEKHHLDYKQSAIDNGITELKKKYQDDGSGHLAAGTIISRAKSQERVPDRKDRTGINTSNTNPETGEKIWQYTGETYEKNGKTQLRTITSTKMAEVTDAYKLTSGGSKENPGYAMEAVYANYANQMKKMANDARKAYLQTPNLEYSPEAKKQYAEEVKSLNAKLTVALKNAPKERQAQLLANKIVSQKLQDNPDMDAEHKKKVKGQALTTARLRMGAKKEQIKITDKEWEAIQKGAISDSKLRQILNNSDMDVLKQKAMPRATRGLTDANAALARSMANSGYTTAEIADRLGVSTATINKAING